MAKGKKGKKSGNAKKSLVSDPTEVSPSETQVAAVESTLLDDLEDLNASKVDEGTEGIDTESPQNNEIAQLDDIDEKNGAERTSNGDSESNVPLSLVESESEQSSALCKEEKNEDTLMTSGVEKEIVTFVTESENIDGKENEEEIDAEIVDDSSSPIETAVEVEEDDDDFGSFDEASFEEFEAATIESPEVPQTQTSKVTSESISRALDIIFPPFPQKTPSRTNDLLSPKAEAHFLDLSRQPRLHPPNWTKSKLRHNLLLQLGIPINLDELTSNSSNGSSRLELPKKHPQSENELDWSKFEVPDLSTLSLTPEEQQDQVSRSAEIFSAIETDNMSNTSELHLQKCSPEELDAKLTQMQANYNQLLRMSSIWRGQIQELKASQDVFESVVQNMVGYNQKVQRKELLDSLRRSGTKRGKKTF